MSEYKLRYYAPHYNRHEEILKLLEEVKQAHGIDYEVIIVEGGEEKAIYERDFAARARILAKRIGGRVARDLRSQRGRGYPYVCGIIAIVCDGKVEWYTSRHSYERWKVYDDDHVVGFLKAVLEAGPKLLEEQVSKTEPNKHERVVDLFITLIKQEFPSAIIEERHPVGKPVVVFDKYGKRSETGKRVVDVLVKLPYETLIVEAEPKLTPEALGQVLVYRELYSKEHPGERVRGLIACLVADEEVLEVCKKYGVEVRVLEGIRKKDTIDWRS